ncbi:MAG: hypothetical protein D3910_01135 [Candidatus Electrothrix sp. ATG2]|nr:hypothetical protein [Candidatus Electrothrix sp. ATG2]
MIKYCYETAWNRKKTAQATSSSHPATINTDHQKRLAQVKPPGYPEHSTPLFPFFTASISAARCLHSGIDNTGS